MIMGMSLAAFTQFHVVLSLVGIAAGILVVVGMWKSERMPYTTALFLATTILTSVTGFMFPFVKVGPPHVFGVISLVLLTFTLLALYRYRLAGRWRWIYVTTAIFALFLNSLVGVVQAFLKIPSVHALAPQGNEPPLLVAQVLLLVIFVVAGVMAVRRFRPAAW
jgi:hypothetical protein